GAASAAPRPPGPRRCGRPRPDPARPRRAMCRPRAGRAPRTRPARSPSGRRPLARDTRRGSLPARRAQRRRDRAGAGWCTRTAALSGGARLRPSLTTSVVVAVAGPVVVVTVVVVARCERPCGGLPGRLDHVGRLDLALAAEPAFDQRIETSQ